jgi:hypothetical protein
VTVCEAEPMTDDAQKTVLLRYLQEGRDALLWKLEGLGEYDIRRPLVPTGTNLLGLVKHVASTEATYLADVFRRPFAEPLPWTADDRGIRTAPYSLVQGDDVVALYKRVWRSSDATVGALPLDAPGVVPWWREEKRHVTLQQILVHMIAETHRHAGHADIVRELVDGTAGLRADNSNLPEAEREWWEGYRDRLEAAAREADSAG